MLDLQQSCRLCLVRFKSTKMLKSHLFKYHLLELGLQNQDVKALELKEQCLQCDKKYLTQSSLTYHIQRIHDSSELERETCNLCYLTYTTSRNLRKHQATIHKNDQDFLNRKIEFGELKFKCLHCDKAFVKEEIKQYHMKMKHQGLKGQKTNKDFDVKPSKCKLCYNVYKSSQRLKEHKKFSHLNEQDLFHRKIELDELKHRCKHCEQVFARDSILKYHVKFKHQTESGNYCKLCYVSIRKEHVVKHRNSIHSDVSEDVFKSEINFKMLKIDCNLCDKKFLTENSQLYHQFVGHISPGTTKCKLCDQDFKNLNKKTSKVHSLLRGHLARRHCSIKEIQLYNEDITKSESEYHCSKCKKSFPSENILNYHIDSCHKEGSKRDLQCQICSKNFAWAFGSNRTLLMKNHMKEEHKISGQSGNETVFNFMKVFNDLKTTY